MPNKTAITGLALTAAVAAAGCGASNNANTSPNPAKSSTPSAQNQSAATAAAPTTGPVHVKLGEWSVSPSTIDVKAGTVTFKATNVGHMPHEMVVLRTGKPAQALGHEARIPETGHVGEISGLKPAQTGTVTLKLKKGHYAIVCNEPGHYEAGMRANLKVS